MTALHASFFLHTGSVTSIVCSVAAVSLFPPHTLPPPCPDSPVLLSGSLERPEACAAGPVLRPQGLFCEPAPLSRERLSGGAGLGSATVDAASPGFLL